MERTNLSMGFCVGVFLTAVSVAWAGTPDRAKLQDNQFFKTIAIADMTEAHLGEMAQNKAMKEPVKEFAQTVVKDQTEEYEQLSSLANKTGESIPKGIDAARYPTIRTLTHMKGASFDRAFLRDEIADQQRIIGALQRESAHGENPDIKMWAGKLVATRQQELKEAQSLAK